MLSSGLYPATAFVPSRESVKGNRAAEAARDARFASDRIPLAAEGKPAPKPVPPKRSHHARKPESVVRPRHPLDVADRRERLRAALPATADEIRFRVPEYRRVSGEQLRNDLHAAGAVRAAGRRWGLPGTEVIPMARPVPTAEHEAALKALRSALPATRKAILAAIPWYDESESRRTTLTKDLHKVGAASGEGGVWTVGGKPAPVKAPELRASETAKSRPAKAKGARAAAAPPLDLRALPTTALSSLACDVACELERRAAYGDRVRAAVEAA